MAVDVTIPPVTKKPPIKVRHRTWKLTIDTPASGNYQFTAFREKLYFDEDNVQVDAPAGVDPLYSFAVQLTPEFLAAHPGLLPLVGGIAQFVDSIDPVLNPPT